MLQQAIGKPSRRAARIKAYLSGGIDAEISQRTLKLQAAPAGVARMLAGHLDGGVLRESWLQPCPCTLTAYPNLSGQNHGLRPARFRRAALDQQQVQASLFAALARNLLASRSNIGS